MIRTKWLVAGLSLAWTAVAAVVVAQEQAEEQKAKIDPTGTWKWERDFGENSMQFTLRMKTQDGKLSGTLDTVAGEQEFEPAELEEAKLEGNKVTFFITRDFNGNEFTVDYEGTVAENEINGLTKVDFGGEEREFDWAAKRGLDWVDVLGEWDITGETPNGNTIEWTLNLSKEGEDVKGTVTSDRFGESEASEIAIKDAQLTFAVVRKFDGNDFRLNYKIDPRGDALKGSVQFGEDTERSFEFTGKRVKEEEAEAAAGDEASEE